MPRRSEWKVVNEQTSIDGGERTDYLKVPGGWIYRVVWFGQVAVTFVPDPGLYR